jgi:protein-S-isoprenylcysteine O-methyltransferase Ste14
MLRRAPRPADGTPIEVRDAAWRRFSNRVSWLMDNDAVAICTLVVATRGTLDVGMKLPVAIAAGVVLCAVGVSVKFWAGAHLPEGSYHWRDFFVPEESHFSASGPYRFFANPMYTIGYAHAYGVALAWLSFPGLLAAAFAQATILALNAFVEQPHFRRTHDL